VPPVKPDLPFKPPPELESDLVLSVIPTVTLPELELVPTEPDSAKLLAKLDTVLTLPPKNAPKPVNLKTAQLVKLETSPNVELVPPDITKMPLLNNALSVQITALPVLMPPLAPHAKEDTV